MNSIPCTTNREQSPECPNTDTTNTTSNSINLDNLKPDDEADITAKSSDAENDLEKFLKCSDEHEEVYNYWKNFEIQKLKNDLNDQINDVSQRQKDYDDLSSKYNELESDLKQMSNEDIFKSVSPLLKIFQSELDNLSNRCKNTERNSGNLFRLLTDVPDPFPVIELVKQLNETDIYDKINKLQKENKDLKEALNAYSNEISLMTKQDFFSVKESKQSEEDKELIYQLSEQVGITTSLNLELTSKLKLSEGEIESYKKILVDYQNEISEMKVKHLNEIKSEFHKDSDKLNKKIDSQSQVAENTKANSNGINNLTKSDKLTTNSNGNNLKQQAEISKLSETNTNKWMNGLINNPINKTMSRNDRLALLQQSLSALAATISPSSNSTPAQLAVSSSTATLKNLLHNKEKQLQSSQTMNESESSHFKPIYKIKNEDLSGSDKNNNHNNNNEGYDSANENDFDEDLMTNHKNMTNSSSSPSCTSPTQNISSSSNYEPINTADIAQKVRDLLSVHNIGQRVFAKYILGLSQGTVSELLSKPKHWDKLTEKGRESYRKMYTWSCSEQSISTLKAISPRKGNKDNYFYQNGKEDSVTEDRINQILNEAQKQMQNKANMSLRGTNLSGSPSPSVSSAISPSNTGSPSMSPTSQQQQQTQQDLLHKASNFLMNNGSRQQKYDDMMMNNYENEEDMTNDESTEEDNDNESRHKQGHKRFNEESFPLDLTVKTNSNKQNVKLMFSNKKIKVENDLNNTQNYSDAENSDSLKISSKISDNNNNSKPLLEKQYFNHNSISALSNSNPNSQSPLKHIQSIADAYLISQFDQNYKNTFSFPLQQSQQQSPTNSNSFQRPSSTPSPALSNNSTPPNAKTLKCILPPVSQEQFDRYSFINTEELVKKVKDLLSKFSISQRLFGECILGLSQGSVSDLLARPKPWQMLTQKGREPFIRMQMFIDDPDAIKKLMANQYKTPSDKISRTNPALIANQFDSKDNLSKIVSQTLSQNNLLTHQNAQSLSQMFANISHTQNLLNISQHQLHHGSNHNSSSVNENSNDSEMKTFQTQINIIPYDISTMSAIGDLNTEEITNRVKETLLNNNIGQKLFGEAVLNLSQGTVSELLSKPKPWNTLSIKGREPYLRMYMWLNDLLRLEKLNEWKEEKNLLKRNSTEVESDHQKPKRRFIFSEEQKDQLMKAFKYDPYPAVNQMEALATKLNLQTRTVINWFHNHRMRIRYKNSTANNQSNNNSTSGGDNSMNSLHLGHSTRARPNSQFNDFTKSLPSYSNSNRFKQEAIDNDQRTRQFNGYKSNNADVNNTMAENYYNYQNNSENGLAENMNDEEASEPTFEDDDEYNDEDQTEKNNLYNEDQIDQEDDETTTKAKAAMALLNRAYNIPNYFNNLNKLPESYDTSENDQKPTEDEEEDDEEEINDSSIQDDLDTDQEAEINSMYIPGHDEQHDQNNENAYNSSSESGENTSNKGNYMSQYQEINNQDANNKNKRRKPHNPQKLSSALNLLNTKLQNKQRVSELSASEDQEIHDE